MTPIYSDNNDQFEVIRYDLSVMSQDIIAIKSDHHIACNDLNVRFDRLEDRLDQIQASLENFGGRDYNYQH